MPKRKAAPTDSKKKYTKKPRAMPKAILPELKAFDIALGDSEFRTAGKVELLNVPTAGTDNYNRVGRKVNAVSIHVRAAIRVFNAGATLPRRLLRILLVWDKQTNATAPSGNDILMDSNAAAAQSTFSFTNLANRERFQILRDEFLSCPVYDATANSTQNQLDYLNPQLHIDWYVPLKGKDTIFNQVNGGTVADIQSGALFLVTYSSGPDDEWTANYASRYRYYDA